MFIDLYKEINYLKLITMQTLKTVKSCGFGLKILSNYATKTLV